MRACAEEDILKDLKIGGSSIFSRITSYIKCACVEEYVHKTRSIGKMKNSQKSESCSIYQSKIIHSRKPTRSSI